MTNELKNDKQIFFNQVKGYISELNKSDIYCSITLDIGHENVRQVNLTAKKDLFNKLTENLFIGDKILAKFFIVSRKKNDRWYTSANLLSIEEG